jgi:5-methylcytosine-specific restriction endonuclease McrA
MSSDNPVGKVDSRRNAPKNIQVKVLRRDRWLCRWCGYPVIFAPAIKYLAEYIRQDGFNEPLAYYDLHWTRRDAPLLDHMGAVIDHVEAHSGGGPSVISNLVTSCNKCNARKSNRPADVFSRRSPLILVNGKYGEPENWDGLSRLFIVLVEKNLSDATKTEREWLRALKSSALLSE